MARSGFGIPSFLARPSRFRPSRVAFITTIPPAPCLPLVLARARARTRGKQGAGGIVVINATRDGLKREGRAKKLGIPKPLRAIRLKCLDCVCQQEKLIREIGRTHV